MDGIALALTAARDFPELTILLMTGFADQRERASGLNAIVHDVVTKPFSVADIRAAVADALAARKGSDLRLIASQPSSPRKRRSSTLRDESRRSGYADHAAMRVVRSIESDRSIILQQPLDVVEFGLRARAGRRAGGAALPGCGEPAAHRFRRESSPSDRRRIRGRAAAGRADRSGCRRSAAGPCGCPGRRPALAVARLHRFGELWAPLRSASSALPCASTAPSALPSPSLPPASPMALSASPRPSSPSPCSPAPWPCWPCSRRAGLVPCRAWRVPAAISSAGRAGPAGPAAGRPCPDCPACRADDRAASPGPA